jgi:polyhydroxybutyrate depolymerase
VAHRRRLAFLVAGLTLAACSGGSPSTAGPTASVAPSPSVVTPSAYPVTSKSADVVVGGDRPVTVHVPPGYDPQHPAPLLIGLHGYGSSGAEQEAYFRLGDLARQGGYLYAFPDGTHNQSDLRFWNGTDACCDFDKSGVDDVGYLAGVIKEIQARFPVDPKRIDVIGHSNGAFMAYAIACAHADEIAAIVSLAGATFETLEKCAPSVPVAVVEIHGTADDQVAFGGGTVQPGQVPGSGSATMAAYPGAEDTAIDWASYDGCTDKQVLDQRLDIDTHLEDAGSPDETTVTRWSGCRPGGAVELWTMMDGVHIPSLSMSFPEDVMDFFEAHPKP